MIWAKYEPPKRPGRFALSPIQTNFSSATPKCFLINVAGIKWPFDYYIIAIAGKEAVHIVEIAIASIYEFALIPFFAQYRPQGKQVFVVWTSHNGLARRRGHGRERALKA